MEFTTIPTKEQPHLDVNGDTGNFAYAVYQMPPGKSYMAEGTTCTWPEWIAAWSRATGVLATYKQVTPEEMIQATGDEEVGREAAYMFSYSSDPGYDGGMELLKSKDLVKVSSMIRPILNPILLTDVIFIQAGIDCPMTSLDDWMARQDWSSVLAKAAF
jgi:hypothetical protein